MKKRHKIPAGKIGGLAEKIAANFLIAQGYQILEINFFNPTGYRFGEIDLITKDPQDRLVFIEVKSLIQRSPQADCLPENNITKRKIIKLQRIIEYYLRRHNLLETEWRLDLVTVIFDFQKRRLQIKQTKYLRY